MKKAIKIILRIFIICWICSVLLSTCVSIHIRTTYLNKEDLKWTKGYYVSVPSVKFYSDSGNVDKLIFGPIEVDNKCPEIFAITSGSPGFKILEPSVYYSFDIKHYNGEKICGVFDYYKANGTDSLLSYCSLGNRKTYPKLPLTSGDFTLNDRTFKNCLIVDSMNSKLSYPDNARNIEKPQIEKFVFSQQFGLIYYKFDNGEEFYRKFKSSQPSSAQ